MHYSFNKGNSAIILPKDFINGKFLYQLYHHDLIYGWVRDELAGLISSDFY
jgi:hypothetical protein